MSTEKLPLTPSVASKFTSSEIASQMGMTSATIQSDKIRPAGKNPGELGAGQAKAAGLQLLLEELASRDSTVRAAAAGALGRLADVSAAPALITKLDDADATVAREAALSLGLLGSSAAVEPLIAVLNNRDGFYHSVVRIAATQSLGQLRDPRAVEPLIHAIKDPIAEASAEAIRSLAWMSDPRGLPALMEVIRNEHGFFLPTTRRAAIFGLGQIGGEQARCELQFVAANQWEDAGVRAAAMEATRDVAKPKPVA